MKNAPERAYVCYTIFRGSPHAAGKSALATWKTCGVYELLDCAAADAVSLSRQNPDEVVCVLAYDQIAGWRAVRCYGPVASKVGPEHVQHAYAYIPQRDYWQLMETMARMALMQLAYPVPDPSAKLRFPSGPTAKDVAECPPARPGEETFDLSDS